MIHHPLHPHYLKFLKELNFQRRQDLQVIKSMLNHCCYLLDKKRRCKWSETKRWQSNWPCRSTNRLHLYNIHSIPHGQLLVHEWFTRKGERAKEFPIELEVHVLKKFTYDISQLTVYRASCRDAYYSCSCAFTTHATITCTYYSSTFVNYYFIIIRLYEHNIIYIYIYI